MITAFALSKTRSRSRPCSPANVIATPSSTAKTMTCSIRPSLIARNGLSGKMSINVCAKPGAARAANPSASVGRSKPTPGSKKTAKAIAMLTAMAVVNR